MHAFDSSRLPFRLATVLLTGSALVSSLPAMAAAGEMAEAAVAAPGQLDEITVTAQRRVENSQDVPLAIKSVDADALAQTGYTDFTDIQYMVPGVQYDPTQGAAFQIRGVGSRSFDFSNAKSVSVVVDGVVMDGQRANGLIGITDMERIDVLMGPQGTLFGKNATSGVISVTTRKPELGVTSLSASGSYGEHDERILNATLNVPLGRDVALRVSGFDQAQDGFGRNVTLDRTIGSTHEYGGRARLLVDAGPDLEFIARADFARHWDSSVRTPAGNQPENVAQMLAALGVFPDGRSADTADGSFGEITTREYGGSLEVNLGLGDHQLKSITAYRETAYDNSTPVNLLPLDQYAYVPFNLGELDTNKFSQEFQLASPTGGFVEYVVGAFYNKLNAQQTQLQWATLGAPVYDASGAPVAPLLYAITGAAGVADANTSLFDSTNETAAAFGQVTLNFTDRFNLALGGRYTHDWNSQSLDFIWLDPEPITGYNPTFVGTSPAPVYPDGKVTGGNFSYRIAPTFHVSDDVMLYATYSTGYKPAGIAFVGNDYSPYRKETVKAWEAGIKSEWWDRRLRVNLDVFLSNFKDFQTTILTTIPDGQGGELQATTIGNAGALRTKGVEGVIALVPVPGLTLNGSFTYTDGEFTDYVYNETTDYTGTALTNSPKFSSMVSADYEHTFASGLGARAHVDYAWRSEYWTVTGQPDYSHVDGYGLVNARVTFTLPDSNIRFGAYARNLFDTYYSTGFQNYGAVGMLHYTSPSSRRTLGGFIAADF